MDASMPRWMAARAAASVSDGFAASSAARDSAAPSSSAPGTTRLTRPSRVASAASKVRPVRISSVAASRPTFRGRRCVPPKVGIRHSTIRTLKASRRTSLLSCQPTTSPSTSRRSGGGRPSKPFATPGQQPPTSSNSTRATSSRDQTPAAVPACGRERLHRAPVRQRGDQLAGAGPGLSGGHRARCFRDCHRLLLRPVPAAAGAPPCRVRRGRQPRRRSRAEVRPSSPQPPAPVQPTRARVSSSVERGTLKKRHTLALLAPPSSTETICSTRSGSSVSGRPPRRPRRLAAARPAMTRSRVSARSYEAGTPRCRTSARR